MEIEDVTLTEQKDGTIVEVPEGFRLISPSGVRHDFRSQGWGKSIQEINSEVLEFEVLHTQRFTGSMFYFFPMSVGDLIFLDFESEKVAVLEVKRFVKHAGFQPSGNDYYDFTADFCGYLGKNGKAIAVFKGYGIPKRSYISKLGEKITTS